MINERPFNYFKNGLAIGVSVGFAGGIFSTLWMKKKQSMNADDVLDQIKAAFLKEGPIEGSWINFEKQPLRKFAVTSQGYTGGITRTEDGQLITYEFLADAKTGTVLDIQRSIID
ncbi:PepSY domain-containing protein [Enterococcus gallinarum]|uniref:PepSY domain-containing protein n=1 Tax=Enterococcus gallinarum TaxID=1353 RepID=UPI00189BB733|nr:PepSY domain-containing protein [Enterococcus gallinarum]